MSLLKVQDLVKTFPSGEEDQPRTVLNGISLELDSGDMMAVTGPSGSGKSTLLNCIGLLDKADQGTIELNGTAIHELDEVGQAAVRGKQIGFVFQDHHLLPQLNVIENILVPVLAVKGSAGLEARTEGVKLLEQVGLKEYAERMPQHLSGGERQRVAVVRALINQPVLLLADEPTGSLDRSAAEALTNLLVETCREKETALIMVTHADYLAQELGMHYALTDGELNQV